MHVYNSLQGWQRDNAGAIRGRLTQGELIASNKHVLFVGLDAYKKAGGTIREDLFGDATVINNRELVAKLVEDKLKAVITALEEQGWGWVRYDEQQDYQFTSYCGRIHPDEKSAPADLLSKQQKLEKQLEKLEQAEIDEDDEDANSANDQKQEELREQIEAVEEEIASKLAYKPAQMKTAGCYVTIDSHGKLKVLRGLVKPSDKRKVESDEGKKSSAKPTKTASGISQALLDSLKAFRLQVAEVAIASTPDLAYDLYTYTTAMSLLAKQSSYQQSLDIILHDKTPIFGEVKGTDAQKRLAELKGQLELGWTSRKTEAEKVRRIPRAERQGEGRHSRLLRGVDAQAVLGTEQSQRYHGGRLGAGRRRRFLRCRLLASHAGQLPWPRAHRSAPRAGQGDPRR